MKNLDITKNINIIEGLKSESLYKIADIFQNQAANGDLPDKCDAISDLLIILYLLAEKMGYSYEKIDSNVLGRLKAALQGEEKEWREDLALLKRHFEAE